MTLSEKDAIEFRRLGWHSRRGMLELDVLLLPFTNEKYLTLADDDKAVYRRLIDCEDQDLFNWLMEKSVSEDPELQRMVEQVIAYARQG